MKIMSLTIRNFKSIAQVEIRDIEQALIFVGKNGTGKTSILDGILAAAGIYEIRPSDFNRKENNIEISMTIEITDADLRLLNRQGIVSKYKRFDIWLADFKSKLPSYQDGAVSFTFVANKEGKFRYEDGHRKNNPYIQSVIPKIYHIDHSRRLEEIQDDIFLARGRAGLSRLRAGKCMFDSAKDCNNCFQCIGMIEEKRPGELSIHETVKLLEYEMVHLDMGDFVKKLNDHFSRNSGQNLELSYMINFDVDQLLKVDLAAWSQERGTVESIRSMSEGMKSIYILSLLETYIEEGDKIPCIIMIEDPEIYLHPQLQKAASELLYRLSKENQVIFSTHSPNMIFNFNSRQIRQVVLNREFYTTVRDRADIGRILDDLGYTANDLMDVSFVFIVEGKQDKNRLPLLLNKYYSEICDSDGKLSRIAIIATNSCTNIKTYANLKYINQLYIKDQFLMIRDGDGLDRKKLVTDLCGYYDARRLEESGHMPRVEPRNVLVLKYYSFENYFLDATVMAEIGIVGSAEEFYDILWDKYEEYLHRLKSFQNMRERTGVELKSREDLIQNMELVKMYGRGHNLFDIFYGRYKGEEERAVLSKYIDAAPRETFQDILDAVDRFVYFDSRRV